MSTQAIDFEHLHVHSGGDASLERDVLRLFIDQARTMLRRLEDAGDAKSWTDAAHGLKGAARAIGALRIAALCERAESLASGATPAERSIVLGDLKVAAAAARRCIERHLHDAPHKASGCRSCAPRAGH